MVIYDNRINQRAILENSNIFFLNLIYVLMELTECTTALVERFNCTLEYG